MLLRKFSAGVTALAIAVSFAACGGSDSKKDNASADKPAAAQKAAESAVTAADAKSAARTGVTIVETCYTESADYSQCKTADALAGYDDTIEWGTEPGQVQVADATASTYTLQSDSSNGVSFTIEKSEDGSTARTCTDGDGCTGGTW